MLVTEEMIKLMKARYCQDKFDREQEPVPFVPYDEVEQPLFDTAWSNDQANDIMAIINLQFDLGEGRISNDRVAIVTSISNLSQLSERINRSRALPPPGPVNSPSRPANPPLPPTTDGVNGGMIQHISPIPRIEAIEVDLSRVSTQRSTRTNNYYTKPELQEICRRYNLRISGTKTDLVNRIQAHFANL
jgi:hypothetical protein